MSHRILAVVAAVVVGLTNTGLALAQTTEPGPAPAGAFESLSPGNQTIARALFAAQPTEPVNGTSPLTLDEIAALKRGSEGEGGQGWGNVFKLMQARGLVQEKNLGQVVSGFVRSHPSATSGTVTTGANETASAHALGAPGGRPKSEGGGAVSAGGPAHGQGGGHAHGLTGGGHGQGVRAGGHGAGGGLGVGRGK